MQACGSEPTCATATTLAVSITGASRDGATTKSLPADLTLGCGQSRDAWTGADAWPSTTAKPIRGRRWKRFIDELSTRQNFASSAVSAPRMDSSSINDQSFYHHDLMNLDLGWWNQLPA